MREKLFQKSSIYYGKKLTIDSSWTIHSLFNQSLDQNANSIALVYNGKTITFNELKCMSNHLVHLMHSQHDVCQGDIIPVCLEKSDKTVVASLSIFASGAVFLPLDSDWPIERIRQILQKVNSKVVITTSNFRNIFEAKNRLCLIDKLSTSFEIDLPEPKISGGDPAYLIFTSGSTGIPKGVMGTHKQILSRFCWSWEFYPFQKTDICVFAPPVATIECIWAMFGPLISGIPLVIPTFDELREPSLFVALLEHYCVSRIELVPSFLKLLLEEVPQLSSTLSEVKLWDISGEMLDLDLVRTLREHNKSTTIVNRMGATEASTLLFHEIREEDLQTNTLPVGRPASNITACIVDDDLNLVDEGTEGELLVSGIRVSRGYYQDALISKDRFLRHLNLPYFQKDEVYFRTGDYVKSIDGLIEYIGRKDDQVKINGFRVNLKEIQGEIKKSIDVHDAVVRHKLNEGVPRLSAFIRLKPSEKSDVETIHQLKKELLSKLPSYSVPSDYSIVDRFPLMPSGKIDYISLESQCYHPLSLIENYVSPRNSIEEFLCSIWKETTGLNEIGIDDSFFLLNGDSITCAKILAKLNKKFNIFVTYSDFFKSKTIRRLGLIIKDKLKRYSPISASVETFYDVCPLSPLLEQMVFLHSALKNQTLYSLYSSFSITGSFDLQKFKYAVFSIYKKFSILRATVESSDGELYLKFRPFDFDKIDIEIDQSKSSLLDPPFSIFGGDLFRIRIFLENENQVTVSLIAHHVITDEWSFQVIHSELIHYYNHPLSKEEILSLEEIPYKQLRYERKKMPLHFWKKYLNKVPLQIALPYDFPIPSERIFSGETLEILIPQETANLIDRQVSSTNRTLFTYLLSALQVFLHQLTFQETITIGAPFSLRDHEELLDKIGNFINPLPIKSVYSDDLTFSDHCSALQEKLFEMKDHQHTSLAEIVDAVCSSQNLNINPLYQVWFTIEDAQNYDSLQFDDVKVKRTVIDPGTSKFDLSFIFRKNGDQLNLYLEFSDERFKKQTAQLILERFTSALHEYFSHPNRKLVSISPPAREKREMKAYLSNFSADSFIDLSVEEIFSQHAKNNPDKIALVSEEEYISFGELEEKSNALAAYFESLFPVQSMVGVSLEHSPFLVETILALLKAGICFIPLDPSLPEERVRFILCETEAKAMITEKIFSKNFGIKCLNPSILRTKSSKIRSISTRKYPQSAAAYTIFTSGTTGQPKGVVLSRGNLSNAIFNLNSAVSFGEEVRFVLNTTISFDIFLFELFSPLVAGGALLFRSNCSLIEGDSLGKFVKRFHVNAMQATPSQWNLLVEGGLRSHNELRIICGGEKLDPPLAKRLLEITPNVWNFYGPTETTIWSTFVKVGNCNSISIGGPIGNTFVGIFDRESSLLAIGQIGEIVLGGMGVATGYFNRPSLTAEKFVPSTFCGRAYLTGDLGFIDSSGSLFCMGREDRQVKIHGHRIELEEIEALCYESGISDKLIAKTYQDSQGVDEIALYIEQKMQGQENEIDVKTQKDSLYSLLKSALPQYMLPKAIIFIEKFPLTPNKKVNLKELPPPQSMFEDNSSDRQMLTPLEKILYDIWMKVLGLKKIDREANFFSIGGHSLNAMKVINRIHHILGFRPPVSLIFKFPTIPQLSKALEETVIHDSDQGKTQDKVSSLSREEYEIWISHKLHADFPVYNITFPFLIDETADPEVLYETLLEVIKVIPNLGATYPEENGKVIKQLRETFPLFRQEKNSDLESQVLQEGSRPFNLASQPPIRLTCCDLGKGRKVIQFTFHHIGVDRSSFPLFFRLFNRLLMDKYSISDLKSFDFPYQKYVAFQSTDRQKALENLNLKYWVNALQGKQCHFNLPYERPKEGTRSLCTQSAIREFSDAFTLTYESFKKSNFATDVGVLLSLLFYFVSRLCQQNEIMIGVPATTRMDPSFEETIGCFVNTLPLCESIDASTHFHNFCDHIQSSLFKGLDHSQFSLSNLFESLGISPTQNNPFFQILFIYEEPLDLSLKISGKEVKPLPMTLPFHIFNLVFAFQKNEGKYQLKVQYAEDLYAEDDIEKMIDYFFFLSTQVLSDSESPIASFSLTSSKEHDAFRKHMDINTVDYQKIPVHQYFEERATLVPDKIALQYEEELLTYHVLNEKANNLAHFLIEKGVRSEDIVGVYLERSLDQVIACLAILKSGGCYAPIDPGFPKERVEFILQDTGLRYLITKKGNKESFDSKIEQIPYPPNAMKRNSTFLANPERSCSMNQLAYVIYTSGSTGKPKGVLIEHIGLANLVGNRHKEAKLIKPHTRVLQLSSQTFDASIWDFLGTVCLGATLVMVKEEALTPGLPLMETMKKYGITHINIPSGALELLPRIKPTLLETMMPIGDVCSKSTMKFWSRTVECFNGYGPTECTIGCVMNEVGEETSHREIGNPLPNITINVVDDFFNTVPAQIVGEFLVGGDGVGRGYLNDPRQTAEKFIPDPLFPDHLGKRVYRTGDFVKRSTNDKIEFVGRNDSQYKIRGFRVDLDEINTAIEKSKFVEKSFIRILTHLNAKVICAFVVLKIEMEESIDWSYELRKEVKSRLPQFMIPQIFFPLKEIPLNRNGKVAYEMFPDPFCKKEGPRRIPPTSTEEVIQKIFSDLLGYGQFSSLDSFFEIGGHSLLANTAIFKINQYFQTQFTLKDLFENPSAQDFAQIIERKDPVPGNNQLPAVKRIDNNEFVLNRGQNRLWLLEKLMHQEGVYHVSCAFNTLQTINVLRLEEALNIIISYHENFRVGFFENSGETFQKVFPKDSVKIRISKQSVADVSQVDECIKDFITQPFDLESPPLVRCLLITCKGQGHYLLFVFHHLVVDGHSIHLFTKELEKLYREKREKEEGNQDVLLFRYRDFIAHTEAMWLGENAQELKLFWKDYLKGYEGVLRLPYDSRDKKSKEHSENQSFKISPKVGATILNFVKESQTTLNAVFMTLLQIFLLRVTGQVDTVIGIPCDLRNSSDWQKVMGYFLNSLPVRHQLEERKSFKELVGSCLKNILDAEKNKYLPFEKIMNTAGVKRSSEVTPLIQLWFVMENSGEYQDRLDLGEVQLTHHSIPSRFAKFPLMLIAKQKGKEITLIWEYSTAFFKESTVQMFTDIFQSVLEEVFTRSNWVLELNSTKGLKT